MSKSKSDKPLAIKTILGCLAVIVTVYILLGTFSHQVGSNFHNPIYIIGVIILGLAFIVCSVWAYRAADGIRYDNVSRAFVVAITVFVLIWACSWVARSNNKKMYDDDVEKAKQSATYLPKRTLTA